MQQHTSRLHEAEEALVSALKKVGKKKIGNTSKDMARLILVTDIVMPNHIGPNVMMSAKKNFS